MRHFFSDEAPIDTLLQIAECPVWDGNLVSKTARDVFVERGWVARCEGYNLITPGGTQVIRALRLCRIVMMPASESRRLSGAYTTEATPRIVSGSDECKADQLPVELRAKLNRDGRL